MKTILKLLLTALVVIILANILPGVTINSYGTAVIVAFTIAILNMIIRPLLVFFTLPATIVTFGLFLFIINACIILLADKLVGDFQVAGFWYALLFSICLSIFRSFLFKLLKDNPKEIKQ